MKRATIKRKLKILPGHIKRFGLKNKDFTILSNNCWGGIVYDNFALEYLSPTIGLFIMPDDYIKLLENPLFYLSKDFEQVSWKDTPFKDMLYRQRKNYKKNLGKDLDDLVIGKLCDIFVVFLHYDSFTEAITKWKRRSKRVNLNNLIVKFNDQNNFRKEDFIKFDNLPFKNKIFYTADKDLKSTSNTKVIYLAQYKNSRCVLDDMDFRRQPFNLKKFLNLVYRRDNTIGD